MRENYGMWKYGKYEKTLSVFSRLGTQKRYLHVLRQTEAD
jgi:hypothetical protein